MFTKIIVTALLIAAVQGQTLQSGKCPDVTVIQDFDVAGYLGTWYTIERYPNPFEQGNCSTATYGPVSEEGLVGVHNTELRDGVLNTIDGTAELTNPNSTEAKLTVKFFNPDSVADYWVLGSDYKNYALVWSCRNFSGGLFHVQFSWILAREKPLPAEYRTIVDSLIEANGIKPEFYKAHDEEACLVQP